MLEKIRSLKRRASWIQKGLLELSGAAPLRGVIGTIAPGDGMYLGDNARYFKVGYSALRCIRLALIAAEKADVGSILDMACGHGRVLRMLKAAFPQANLTGCDLNRDGADFCAKTFGATPVYSAEHPAQLVLPGRYDLIWSGSLFTHLDTDRWPGFLNLLQEHMNPGGLLVFTTHGRLVAARLRERSDRYGLDPGQIETILKGYDAEGFGYARQSATDQGDWGLCACRTSWVLSHLENRPEFGRLGVWERCWDGHQDVFSAQFI